MGVAGSFGATQTMVFACPAREVGHDLAQCAVIALSELVLDKDDKVVIRIFGLEYPPQTF